MRTKPNTLLMAVVAFAMCIASEHLLPAGALPEMDAERAFTYLRKQVEFGPRVPQSDSHRRTQKLILETLAACGFTTVVQEFDAFAPAMGKTVRGYNLIGYFPSHAKPRFVFSAHYDTRCIAERDANPARHNQPIPGANDGASGVAVLLELAHVVAKYPPHSPIALVFFDVEDQGTAADPAGFCLGSRYMAANLPAELRDFELGINLDMVGDRDLLLPYEAISYAAAPDVMTELWNIGARIAPSVFVKKKGPAVYDDHVPFIEAKKKFVNVIDFEYTAWHTSDDCVDKCSPRSLKTCGDTLVQFLFQ